MIGEVENDRFLTQLDYETFFPCNQINDNIDTSREECYFINKVDGHKRYDLRPIILDSKQASQEKKGSVPKKQVADTTIEKKVEKKNELQKTKGIIIEMK